MARDSEGSNKYVGYKSYAAAFNQAARQYVTITGDQCFGVFDTDNMPGFADAVIPQWKLFFDQVHMQVLMLEGALEEFEGPLVIQIADFADFISRTLRRAIFDKPERERQVQDALEAIFIGRGMNKPTDYDLETGRVKYSGKEFVPDFILPAMSAAIEVKLLKKASEKNIIVDQLCADCPAYLSAYETLIAVVYDLGVVRDELEFRSGFDGLGNVHVVVVKH